MNSKINSNNCAPALLNPEVGEADIPTSTVDSAITTTFVDDGEIVKNNLVTPVESTKIPDEFESIKDFLGKPFLCSPADNVWPSYATAPVDTAITGSPYRVSTVLNSNPHWVEKLRGFAYFRANVVFRVIINCQPFQSGKLLIHFLPNVADRPATYTAIHNVSYVTKTQQPHVELDASQSMAEIELPFIHFYDYMNVVDGFPDFGSFYIDVLAPLRTGTAGDLNAPISVYMYFKNVELIAPLVPQSGHSSKRFAIKSVSSDEMSDIISKGSISHGLSQAATMLDSISTIPSLTSVAKDAAWVARQASGVASTLGYAKPMTDAPPDTSSRQLNKYTATSDGVDSSYPLTVIPDSATKITSGYSIRDEDEMSINFLKTIPCCMFQYTWDTSVAWNIPIAAFNVAPDTFFNVGVKGGSTNTTTYAVGPPMWYLTKLFKYWRGSIKLKFKFAKTVFHTGRLQVTFTPGYFVGTTPTLITSDVSLREIIDLKTSNEFTLHLPYLLPFDYSLAGDYMGRLDVRVLNPLRCPGTCSPVIDVLLYASAGSDFEYAVPNAGNTGAQQSTGKPIVFTPETGEIDEPIGSSTLLPASTDHSSRAVGEQILSTRQLLNRMAPVYQTSSPFSAAASGLDFVIWPWFVGIVSNLATGLNTYPNAGGDLYSFLAPLYAFWKGGMRVQVQYDIVNAKFASNTSSVRAMIYPSLNTSNNWPIERTADTLLVNAVSRNWITNYTSTGLGMVITDCYTGPATFKVPYYNRFKCSMVTYQRSAATDVVPTAATGTPTTKLLLSVDENRYVNFLRSIDEDFQFTYFIGCPPLWVSNAPN